METKLYTVFIVVMVVLVDSTGDRSVYSTSNHTLGWWGEFGVVVVKGSAMEVSVSI